MPIFRLVKLLGMLLIVMGSNACAGTATPALSPAPADPSPSSSALSQVVTSTSLTKPNLTPAPAQRTTSGEPTLTPIARPTPAGAMPLPPLEDTTTWHLPDQPNVNSMRHTILQVLQANELEFDLGYPVQGFKPDPIYPRLFIRDTSTLMKGASYFYPAERLKWGVEGFLRQQYELSTVSSEDGWQAGFGAISATVGPDGTIDKATAVADEETHLLHAAYVVYQAHGGAAWLKEEINGLPVIARLNAAGDWLLAHRRDKATGLIKRDHTTDWGDVRFQPTTGNPTDIVPEDVVWTASIYDQALAYRAWRELAAMNRAVGDEAAARRWQAEAETLQRATHDYLWQPERGFYRTHLHLTPLRHDFDEEAMVSITNAVAIGCGLTDALQNAMIVDALENARLVAGAQKPGVVLFPPYPEGFFKMPSLAGRGVYQNGGVWDWWGGWQVLAEFETGYSRLARAHLLQTAADWANHPGQIFEWQEVTTLAGHGGEQYAGAAGVYTQVIVEGLYGVQLSLDSPTLSPRLGDWPGRITVHQPPSGLYLRYHYQPAADALILAYETNYQGPTFPLRLLLPTNFAPGPVFLDGGPLAGEQVTVGQDHYFTAALPAGRHDLVVNITGNN
ncbi:MAG: hypothetical protein JW953_16970 [Anaerolineae bacterium]|nr:hypothetical protein [Anaerolineae bacterium]